jgi:DNA polymerase-1
MDKLAASLKVTKQEAFSIRDQVFAGMPKIENLIKTLKQLGRDHEKIFTVSGRIVPIPTTLYDGKWSVAAHKAVNYTIQGSAYDVLAEACIAIEEAGLGDAVYMALHDELVVSTDAAEDVRRIMATPPERLCQLAGRTPVLRTDMKHLGERWATA